MARELVRGMGGNLELADAGGAGSAMDIGDVSEAESAATGAVFRLSLPGEPGMES